MPPPRGWVRRMAAQLRPSVAAGVLLSMVLLLLGLELGGSSLIGLLFQAVSPGEGAYVALQLHDLLFALLVAPVATCLLGLAATLGSAMGFRALLLGLQSLVLAIAAVAGTILFLGEPNGLPAAGVMFFCYGTAALAAAVLALGATVAAFTAARQQEVREAELWVAGRLGATGWLAVDDAADTLGHPAAWVHDLAVRLVVDHQLPVRHQGGWLVSRDRVATSMARLVAALSERGRATLAELASAIETPEALCQGWVDELALDPALPIAVDRDRGEVLWDPHTAARDTTWCPRCGGPEHLAGGGLVRCTACGSEREPHATEGTR